MKLKVCGMKYGNNILDVSDLYPDYMGFIFYSQSPRFFEGTMPELPKNVMKVGVFVNESVDVVKETVTLHSIDVVQLHGEEGVTYIEELRTVLPDVEIIKVFGIKDEFDFSALIPFQSVVDYFLFDTKGKHRGGNGVKFDWTVLSAYPSDVPFFLSGGIGLDTLDALQEFAKSPIAERCAAIDVNSKFEIEPGMKSVPDLLLLKKELERIKTAK